MFYEYLVIFIFNPMTIYIYLGFFITLSYKLCFNNVLTKFDCICIIYIIIKIFCLCSFIVILFENSTKNAF